MPKHKDSSLYRKLNEDDREVVVNEKDGLGYDTINSQHGDHVRSRQQFRVYWTRWVMLGVYSMMSASNSMLWVAFSPVATHTEEYYGISSAQFNWISSSFYFSYLPACLAGMWLLNRHGLRVAMVTSALLNAVGGAARCLTSESLRYPASIAGSVFGGAACAIFLGVPSNIANVWFGESERALATGVAVAANQIGILFGFLFSPIIVKQPGDIRWLNITIAIYTGVCFIINAAFFRSKPPSPPSETADSSEAPFRESIARLKGDKNAWVLAVVYMLVTGIFWAFSALLGEIFQAHGYTSTECGILGVIFLGTGVVGELVAGYLIDRTHAYKALGSSCLGIVSGLLAMTTLMYQRHSMSSMGVIIAVLGFFQSAQMPVLLELMVDTTFPASEAVSGTSLMLVAQFGALGATFTATGLTTASGDMTRVLWVYTGVYAFSLALFVLLFQGRYLRFEFEQQKEKMLILDESSTTVASETPIESD